VPLGDRYLSKSLYLAGRSRNVYGAPKSQSSIISSSQVVVKSVFGNYGYCRFYLNKRW